jgi:hypothetical protein
MDIQLTETYFTLDRIHPLGVLVLLVIAVVPFWPLFRKAGFSGPLSLLMLVPGVNLVVLYVVAFSRPRTAS